MPHCPFCGSSHIVISVRQDRRGHCLNCDLRWSPQWPVTREPEGERDQATWTTPLLPACG